MNLSLQASSLVLFATSYMVQVTEVNKFDLQKHFNFTTYLTYTVNFNSKLISIDHTLLRVHDNGKQSAFVLYILEWKTEYEFVLFSLQSREKLLCHHKGQQQIVVRYLLIQQPDIGLVRMLLLECYL